MTDPWAHASERAGQFLPGALRILPQRHRAPAQGRIGSSR